MYLFPPVPLKGKIIWKGSQRLHRNWLLSHPVYWSVQSSRSVVSDSLRPMDCSTAGFPVHNQLPEFTQTHLHWVGDAIQLSSSSIIPFFSRLQSFPASGSFQVSQFLPSGGQSIGVSTSTSVLPMNIQDWSPLGWTGWISLQSKGFSNVFSNTTTQF